MSLKLFLPKFSCYIFGKRVLSCSFPTLLGFFVLTKNSKTIVESDNNDISVGCEDAAVKEIAGAPGEALAVDEHHHRVVVLVAVRVVFI